MNINATTIVRLRFCCDLCINQSVMGSCGELRFLGVCDIFRLPTRESNQALTEPLIDGFLTLIKKRCP